MRAATYLLAILCVVLILVPGPSWMTWVGLAALAGATVTGWRWRSTHRPW